MDSTTNEVWHKLAGAKTIKRGVQLTRDEVRHVCNSHHAAAKLAVSLLRQQCENEVQVMELCNELMELCNELECLDRAVEAVNPDRKTDARD